MKDQAAVSVREALSRLAADEASTADQSDLQRAALEGRLVAASGDRSIAFGGAATGAIIVSGDLRIAVEHGPDFGQKLLDFLFPRRTGRFPPRPELLFLGRSGALGELKRRLGASQGRGSGVRLVIEGLPGVGKTTLVGVLSYDQELAVSFPDGVLWTSLGQEPGVLGELTAWARSIGLQGLERCPTVREAIDRLRECIANRSYLIIVDDVWDAAHATPFLQAAGIRCGVLVTTRRPVVADALRTGSDSGYLLPVLGESDGITLLSLLAPDVVGRNRPACVELVRDLECLPLALQVAGRLLDAEVKMGWSVDELLATLREGAAIIEAKAPADRVDVETQTIPTVAALLRRSTDVLGTQARNCFAQLGAFAPKPATFDVDALAAVWGTEDPRPIVRELAASGLLLPAGGRFQVHSLLVAHARSLFKPNSPVPR